MKKLYSNKLTIFLFLAPALFFFITMLIMPIFMCGYYSLFYWDSVNPLEFRGFSNYAEIFTRTDINFGKSLMNAGLLALFSVFIQLPLALFLALILANGRKGERAFTSIYFMPVLISTVVIGQLWLKIYEPYHGVLNIALRSLHLEDNILNSLYARGLSDKTTVVPWLGNKWTALGAVFIPTLWQYVGYHMLLLYAGIKSVPPEYREAAKIDGASEGQVNWHIVLPHIKPILRISTIFAVTGSLKSFDLIYVLTGSSKTGWTDVPIYLMRDLLFTRNSFKEGGGTYGLGSTVAFLLIMLCFAAAIIINMLFKERGEKR